MHDMQHSWLLLSQPGLYYGIVDAVPRGVLLPRRRHRAAVPALLPFERDGLDVRNAVHRRLPARLLLPHDGLDAHRPVPPWDVRARNRAQLRIAVRAVRPRLRVP